MAIITPLQATDYLKDSRAVINTNFNNLNTSISALSVQVSALSTQGALGGHISVTPIVYPGLNNLERLSLKSSDIFIQTTDPIYNGYITLSSNGGYTQIITEGPGTRLVDDLAGSNQAGKWLEFYRANPVSGANINSGPVYYISDGVNWPRAGETNEGLKLYGNRKDSSIAITSFTGYNNTVPGVYIPSISSSSTGYKVEILGQNGVLTRKLTVGTEPFYGAPDNPAYGENNLEIVPFNTPGFGAHNTTIQLSAADALKTIASRYLIGTSHPQHNGYITLSSNGGFIQLITNGPGTQLIDDMAQSNQGGTWLEFYRQDPLGDIPTGNRYVIADKPNWPRNDEGINNEALTLYGRASSTSIVITSAPGYNDLIPGFYIPSRRQALSGYQIEMLGETGILTRKITVGNKELYAFGITPLTAVNVTTSINNETRTLVVSAHEPTTSICIKAGTKGKIDLKSGGHGVGGEVNRYLQIEGRTIKVVNNNPAIGASQLQINASASGNYAGLMLMQDPQETYGFALRSYGNLFPYYAAGSGAEYGRGLTIKGIDGPLNLGAVSVSSTSSANVYISPDNGASLVVVLLSATNSTETSAISLRMFRDVDTFVIDANPDNWVEGAGTGYTDLRIQNSSKSYGVQIPNVQVDHIHNYNTGNITISARDVGNIIVVPATSAENLWVKEGGLKFPDNTRQITAGITVNTNTYPPSASTALGATNTFIVSAGIAYLCTQPNIWVKWTVDTTW